MALYISGCPGLSAIVLDWNSMGKWGDLWASSHLLRHKLFIEKRQWNAPKSHANMECDEYDDMATIYVIVTDDGSNALAMARLRPTTLPYMIEEVFPHLYPGKCPKSKYIWEATRFAAAGVESGIKREVTIPATRLLIQTMLEFAESQSIDEYIALMPLAAYRIIRGLGGVINETGETTIIDDKKHCIAKMPTNRSKDIDEFEKEFSDIDPQVASVTSQK